MIRIGDRCIAPDEPPYVIAEIGVNHDGSPQRAVELARAACDAGADAVKLQSSRPDALLSSASRLADYQRNGGATDPFDLLRQLELSLEAMDGVIDAVHARGVQAIVTVFSLEHVAAATALPWDAYKIASPDVINKPLIDALRATKAPLILSTGAADLEEVQQALAWISGDHPLIVMQCVSSYPTPLRSAALAGRIALEALTSAMPRASGKPGGAAIGYSDHTPDVMTGALAVASGARVLEKHLTHDRNAPGPGPDHGASLDPRQFAAYVDAAHDAFAALGPREKRCQSIERDVRAVSRQSIVTTTDLDPGHVIARRDLTIKRPGTGIAPQFLDALIGATIAHAIDANTPLQIDDLQTSARLEHLAIAANETCAIRS